MGKVFSPEEIQAGHIPQEGAHEQAGHFLLDQLFEPSSLLSERQLNLYRTATGCIDSAMVYGSTAFGRAGLRSDLDIFVNYREDQTRAALYLLREIFSEIEETYRVPVEPNVLPAGALGNPLQHRVDPLFAKHLLEVQGMEFPQWSYNDPVEALKDGVVSNEDTDFLRMVTVKYLNVKALKFSKAQVGYRGEVDLHVMQRGLELPSAIGRKILEVTNGEKVAETYCGRREDIAGLLDKRLEEILRGYPKGGWLATAQTQLSQLDGEYTQLLEATIANPELLPDYVEWLKERYPFVCQASTKVSRQWANIIGEGLDIKEAPGLTNYGDDYC